MSQKISTFAKRLREALDERGMTQATLAQMSGISKSSISRYLSGAWEGKQDAVYALSKALNVNEAWLMGYDVTMERGPAGVEQAGNIYEARAAGINLLDETTGIDSSAIPGLLKEAIAKSGESVEEIAKKTSNLPETLQDIISGRNYVLPLWRIASLSYYLHIPLSDMIKADPNGSPSAVAFQQAREQLAQLKSPENGVSKEESLERKEKAYETMLQIYTDTSLQLMSFEKAIFPDDEVTPNWETGLTEFAKKIEKLDDPEKKKEIHKRIREIVKILHGNQ